MAIASGKKDLLNEWMNGSNATSPHCIVGTLSGILGYRGRIKAAGIKTQTFTS